MITEQQRQELQRQLEAWEASGKRGRPELSLPVAEVCPVQDIGVDGYVQCLEARSHACPQSVAFGSGYLCRCPVRVKLKKQYGI